MMAADVFYVGKKNWPKNLDFWAAKNWPKFWPKHARRKGVNFGRILGMWTSLKS